MAIVLGIDTGGTFTDSVIVDTETRKVLSKAKALTTTANLATGIDASLAQLNKEDFEKVSFVSLSTTLATNAIVEGRKGRVGLVLLGSDIAKPLPADIKAIVDGEINIKGHIQKDINYEQLDEAFKVFTDRIDVLAVSGFASTKNPVHEKKVREYARKRLNVPIICAHELTGQLGYYERTVTCVINAGLLPIIRKLITEVRLCIDKRKTGLPLMVVKGDGSLMHEAVALERPIETLLSGPAASIIGAEFLTNIEYAMILDMGGTTTDIADMTNGKVHINEEGARVAGWSTRVRAADICTFGIGGDSHIFYDTEGTLQIGPQKVIPICTAAAKYPHLKDELEYYKKPAEYELCIDKETDCFEFAEKISGRIYSDDELEVLETLKKSPHSIFCLAAMLGRDTNKLGLTRLVEEGSIYRISLTPTDILHAEGHLSLYEAEASRIAVKIMAKRKEMTPLEFIIECKRLIYRKLASACVQSACSFEGGNFDVFEEASAQYFMKNAFSQSEKQKHILQPQFVLKKPIIAIGAPVKSWLYNVGQHLNTTIVVPEHAEVANAIGAATGQILEESKAIIRYDMTTKQYIIFTREERITCRELESAKKLALDIVTRLAETDAQKAGCQTFELITGCEDKYTEVFTSDRKDYVESIVKAIVMGKPKWDDSERR